MAADSTFRQWNRMFPLPPSHSSLLISTKCCCWGTEDPKEWYEVVCSGKGKLVEITDLVWIEPESFTNMQLLINLNILAEHNGIRSCPYNPVGFQEAWVWICKVILMKWWRNLWSLTVCFYETIIGSQRMTILENVFILYVCCCYIPDFERVGNLPWLESKHCSQTVDRLLLYVHLKEASDPVEWGKGRLNGKSLATSGKTRKGSPLNGKTEVWKERLSTGTWV